MRFKWLIIVSLLVVSCKKKERFENIGIIGHAGSGLNTSTSLYVDNSYEAVQYAASFDGIDGVEVDIQCSTSNSAWLFHDDKLDDRTDGSGCVASSSDDYLGGIHYEGWENEKLVKLVDLNFPYAQKRLFLDVRSSDLCAQQMLNQQEVIQSIELALPAGQTDVTVVTNQVEWVHLFYLKGWKVFLNLASAQEYMNSPLVSETVGLCIRNNEISGEEVRSVQQTGKEVIIFDVRSPKGIRKAFRKYPDFVMTDNLKAAIIEKYP